MITGDFDLLSEAWRRGDYVFHEFEVERLILRDIVFQIHHLDAKIDALDRGIGSFGRQDILFAQDWSVSRDQEARPDIGVGDKALADNDSFEGLQLDLEGHDLLPLIRSSEKKTAGCFPAADIFGYLGVRISAGAEARSAATDWRARARTPQSTDGSRAPGCSPLPRWCRRASGSTSRSAER